MHRGVIKLSTSSQREPCRLSRTEGGVARLEAADLEQAMFGLGYAHARDRGLQMLLARILGRGEACAKLQDDEEMLELDRFFRRWNLGADAAVEEAKLSKPARNVVEAYCQGVNRYFSHARVPWELRLLKYRFELWTVADIFLTAKLAGLIGLAQTQGEMEQFIIECVQQGLSRERLEELFARQLEGMDEQLLRKVKLPKRLIPESIQWASALPRMIASNNWAIAGNKTASGSPLFCNDPHLQINRLPPVWYEAVLRWRTLAGPRYAIGATLPGVPGVIFGRTPDLAWGVTYAFMDCIDSWIEECREGQCRREHGWVPFRARKEIILRKKQPPVELVCYENEHGLLAGDPLDPGYYLATRWSCAEGTSATALESITAILDARTVEEGRRLLADLSNASWNWVLADRLGNIGYQMSGKMPRRRLGVSGLVPLPGWDSANDWRGFEPPENLPRALNPAQGFIATANEDLNYLGQVRPINLPMAPYRAERIGAMLSRQRNLTVADMKGLQFDFYSVQAEKLMAIIRPLLDEFAGRHPETVRWLSEWDLTYGAPSKGAFLFEQVYRALLNEVFGQNNGGFGPTVLDRLIGQTSLFNLFFGNFDRVLLSPRAVWFAGRTQAEIFRAALAKAFATGANSGADRRRVMRMQHLLLGGKLPRALGFDRLLELRGNRATVHQTQVYRSGRREVVFGPSLCLITDLATDEVHTTLPGGPSDRRFSRWYGSGLPCWSRGEYKTLSGHG